MIDEPFIPRGSGVPRTPSGGTKGKLHLTDVIHAIEHRLDRHYKGNGFEDRDLTMEVGFWWEEMLGMVHANRHAVRIGEVEKDDIIGSPDGKGPDTGVVKTVDGKPTLVVPPIPGKVVLEEYKFTWKSSKNSPSTNWYWMTQCKSYCHMLGLDTVVMRICHIMGNYKGSGPLYRVARIAYTERELYENWRMITEYAEEMKPVTVR